MENRYLRLDLEILVFHVENSLLDHFFQGSSARSNHVIGYSRESTVAYSVLPKSAHVKSPFENPK